MQVDFTCESANPHISVVRTGEPARQKQLSLIVCRPMGYMSPTSDGWIFAHASGRTCLAFGSRRGGRRRPSRSRQRFTAPMSVTLSAGRETQRSPWWRSWQQRCVLRLVSCSIEPIAARDRSGGGRPRQCRRSVWSHAPHHFPGRCPTIVRKLRLALDFAPNPSIAVPRESWAAQSGRCPGRRLGLCAVEAQFCAP